MDLFVLRSTKKRRSAFTPIGSIAHDPGELSITLEKDISPREIGKLNADDGVAGYAPPMPLHLIKSLRTPGTDQSAAPRVSWGIEAVGAGKPGYDGAGVTVAVLDTGIEKKHSAFRGLAIETKNFTGDVDADTDGHGTHCAGSIFGRPVDGSRIGVAPGVERALVGKVIGSGGGATNTLVEAIHWAWSGGAHIISMSLGMDYVGYRERLLKTYPDRVATSMALAGYRANVLVFDRLSHFIRGSAGAMRGAVVTAASGNESRRDDRADYKIVVSPPAAGELFLSVAAVGQDLPALGRNRYMVAPFSNVGARLAAPGVGIWSAALGGGLTSEDGTSMATPHVAGVAALWAQKLMKEDGRRFNASLVAHHIERAAIGLPGLEYEDVGLGLVQAP